MDKKTILIVVAVIIALGVILGVAMTTEEPEELEPNAGEEVEEPAEEGEDVEVIEEEGENSEEETPEDDDQGEENLSDENTVNIYFLETVEGQEVITPVAKEVTSEEQIEEAILLALLEGPSEEGLFSAIAEGTELLSLEIEDGVATANFSSELKPGGGSAMVTAIKDQITRTLEQFDSVNEVVILVEGEEGVLQP